MEHLVTSEPVPAWLRELAAAAGTMQVPARLRPPACGGRRSAVLVLFAAGPNGPDDPDLLFIRQCGPAAARGPAGVPRRGHRRHGLRAGRGGAA